MALMLLLQSQHFQISNHLSEIGKDHNVLTTKYDIILMGDFNAELTDAGLSDFCEIYNPKNIVKEKTCFQNQNNRAVLI